MRTTLLFLSVLFFISCNDEEYVEEFVEANLSSDVLRICAGGDGRYDVLGMSYDATESNLSDVAVRLPVIDMNKVDMFVGFW
ncbi:hypothetical protein [Bacteroides faecalis]|uniref:Uncharacterized protein n=1 Tax=Bacteroides faecalis TaxID=2447885 RepID=A0A401LNV3_9BACE|nr:hypothetical protein [Bacteroides faecalis]GCB33137.1 hypothetical protein KGMB02408_00820 [Bacteroides faecalis]